MDSKRSYLGQVKVQGPAKMLLGKDSYKQGAQVTQDPRALRSTEREKAETGGCPESDCEEGGVGVAVWLGASKGLRAPPDRASPQ